MPSALTYSAKTIVVSLFALVGAVALVERARAQEPARLFQRVDPSILSPAIEAQKAPRRGTEVLGIVRLNAGILQPAAGSEQKELVLNLAETIDLKLDIPGGADIRAQLTMDRVQGVTGQTSWAGQVRGVADSSVTFTYADGVVAGTIRLRDTTIKIRRTRDDLYAIEKVNQRDHPDEAHPRTRSDLQVPRRSEDVARDRIKECEVDPSIKDLRVLILNTDAAERRAGSAADFAVLVGDIVGEANLALKNSKVRVRLSIAAIARVSIAGDVDSDKYLDNLSANKEARQLRDRHKAHIVSLLDYFPSGYKYCGVGYVMTNAQDPSKEIGYNVVDLFCAWDMYSLVHEIAHNMGAGHNKEKARSRLFSYSYGLRWPNRFRTIMAYSCKDRTPCDRIPRFTNPDLEFSGVKIGDKATADNARTLNQSRCFVAGWN